MRTTSTVLALAAAAGVVLAADTAHAAPSPAPDSGWTVTTPKILPPTPSADATSGTTAPRRVSRAGVRLAVGCQPLRDGVWVVRPSDTLWRISVCTGRDLGGLVTVNRLSSGGRLIFPGDRITV